MGLQKNREQFEANGHNKHPGYQRQGQEELVRFWISLSQFIQYSQVDRRVRIAFKHIIYALSYREVQVSFILNYRFSPTF